MTPVLSMNEAQRNPYLRNHIYCGKRIGSSFVTWRTDASHLSNLLFS